MAEKSLGDRSGCADFLLAEIGLGVSNDSVFDFHAVGDILHRHLRHQRHFLGAEFAFVYDAGVGNKVLEFSYFHFEHTLGLFGSVVFGVFGQVALVSGFGYGGGNAGALHAFEIRDLLHLFLVAVFGHESYSHDIQIFFNGFVNGFSTKRKRLAL